MLANSYGRQHSRFSPILKHVNACISISILNNLKLDKNFQGRKHLLFHWCSLSYESFPRLSVNLLEEFSSKLISCSRKVWWGEVCESSEICQTKLSIPFWLMCSFAKQFFAKCSKWVSLSINFPTKHSHCMAMSIIIANSSCEQLL